MNVDVFVASQRMRCATLSRYGYGRNYTTVSASS
jgi:hypothetical protein